MSILLLLLSAILSNLRADQCIFSDSSLSTEQQLYLGYFPANHIVLRYKSQVAGPCDYARYSYSPCNNGVDCGGGAKESQVDQWCGGEENTCVKLSKWDNGVIQPSYNASSETWTFKYENGESYHCQNSSNRTVTINWHCNMDVSAANITSMIEPGACNYIINIDSKWSCLGQIYNPSKDDESSNSDWLWIVLLVVGVLIILSLSLFTFYKKRQKKDKNQIKLRPNLLSDEINSIASNGIAHIDNREHSDSSDRKAYI